MACGGARGLALTIALALVPVAGAWANEWSALVLIFPSTTAYYKETPNGPEYLVSGNLTDPEIQRARAAARDFARLVPDWSNGLGSVALHTVVVPGDISKLTVYAWDVDPNTPGNQVSYWVAPDDIAHVLRPYLDTGRYDSVFVIWTAHGDDGNENIPTPGHGGLGYRTTFGTHAITYASLYYESGFFAEDVDPLGEALVHEWLHGVSAPVGSSGIYRDRGYQVADSDAAGAYGFVDANGPATPGGFETYYRAALTGRIVASGNEYTGISDAVWRSGAARPGTLAAPAPAQAIAPLDGACVAGPITLEWRAPSEVGTTRTVRLVPDSNPLVTLSSEPLTGSTLSWTVPAGALPAGESFTWRVHGSSAAGESDGDVLRFVVGGEAKPPILLPPNGARPSPAQIFIRAANPRSELRYTTDGSDPQATSPLVSPDGVVDFDPPAEIRAREWMNGCAPSPIVSGDFVSAEVLLVTNTDNAGDGSLRKAIEDSNATSDSMETIEFAIPGLGTHTISLFSPLPTIVDPVVIDGWSQPGWNENAPVPLIELNGNSAGGVGLLIEAGDSIVRGLTIGGFLGRAIYISQGGGNAIQNCYLGTTPDGAGTHANGQGGILLLNSPNNLIGGSTPRGRNVISGNGGWAVEIQGVLASGNLVSGNYLGTNAAGTGALRNTLGGVGIFDAPGTSVGGADPGLRNVISGNGTSATQGVGVAVAGATATGTEILGNYIGTNAAGTAELGNTRSGIHVAPAVGRLDAGCCVRIGGTAPGEGNLISGNEQNGIAIVGGATGGNQVTVEGNKIGTDVSGNVDLGNTLSGVVITRSEPSMLTPGENTIGGRVTAARNLISGNDIDGVQIVGGAGGADQLNVISGNFIGTNGAGSAALGNGRSGVRLTLPAGCEFTDAPTHNLIGGVGFSAGNLISGNGAAAVVIFGGSPGSGHNTVYGNRIGTDVTGTLAFTNGGEGVLVSTLLCSGSTVENRIGGVGGAANLIGGGLLAGVRLVGSGATQNHVHGNRIGISDTGGRIANLGPGIAVDAPGNLIGSSSPGEGNVIAENSNEGIRVLSGVGNELRGNAIFENDGLGIDLAGGNLAQPAPVITSATVSEGIAVAGSLTAAPNQSYTLEFFASAVCDASGSGEGERSLALLGATTGAAGTATFLWTDPQSVAPGEVITATATDSAGNTSEFSACRTTGPGGPADPDGDNPGGGGDNCPYVPNPTQADSGRVGSSVPDGIGDACQCGDVAADGRVDAADVALYRDHLRNPAVYWLTDDARRLCSIVGEDPQVCDLLDLVVLRRALAGSSPGVSSVCDAAAL
jgi:hypothetical protein